MKLSRELLTALSTQKMIGFMSLLSYVVVFFFVLTPVLRIQIVGWNIRFILGISNLRVGTLLAEGLVIVGSQLFNNYFRRQQANAFVVLSMISLAADLDREKLLITTWKDKKTIVRRLELIATLIERQLAFLRLEPDEGTRMQVAAAAAPKIAWIRSLKWWVISPQPQTLVDLVTKLVDSAYLISNDQLLELPDALPLMVPKVRRGRQVLNLLIPVTLLAALVFLILFGNHLGGQAQALAPFLQVAFVAALARSGVQLSNLSQEADIAQKLAVGK